MTRTRTTSPSPTPASSPCSSACSSAYSPASPRPTPRASSRDLDGRSHGERGSASRGLDRRTTLALVLALLAAFGCGPLGLDGPAEEASPERESASTDGEVAVVVEGDPITVAELDAFLQQRFLEDLMRQPEEEIFEARERGIQELVQQRVVEREARARDLTADELFEQITGSAQAPTEEEIASWYQENQSRLRGATLEQVSSQIGQFLLEQRRREAWQAFIGPRLDALSYEMVLAPPRKDLEATRLVRGPVDAPVTLMAFSDYQCPFCIRSEPVLAEVLSRYPERLRLVHRHFPLENVHPFARAASEAAMCAEEQGKFWAYHDAIFARGGRLTEATFGELADALELEREAFDTCVEQRRYADFVEQDIRAGEAAGVTGTPAFFVNGIPLKGARDAEELSRIVESELERLGGDS